MPEPVSVTRSKFEMSAVTLAKPPVPDATSTPGDPSEFMQPPEIGGLTFAARARAARGVAVAERRDLAPGGIRGQGEEGEGREEESDDTHGISGGLFAGHRGPPCGARGRVSMDLAATLDGLRLRAGPETAERAAARPASSAVANAAWKFRPPIGPWRSRISPMA